MERKGRGATLESHGNSEKSERRQYGSSQAGFAPSFVIGKWKKKVWRRRRSRVGGGTGDWPSVSHSSAELSSGGPCTGMVEISGVLHNIMSSSE